MIARPSAAELDRERRAKQEARVREAKLKIIEFLDLNLTLGEQTELINDLHQRLANDLRRNAWHREARS
jgi:hypothetical protein